MRSEYFYWLLGFLFLLLPFSASAYQIDQAQLVATHSFSVRTFAPVGQSFVPRHEYLLGATFKLMDAGGAGMGNWMKIQLRRDAMDGEVVAVSEERYLEDCFNFIAGPGCNQGGGNPAEITFLFTVPQQVTVDATYVMELVVDPLGDGILVAHSSGDTYSDGGYYRQGMPYAADLWFRTLAPGTPEILVSSGNQLRRFSLQGELLGSDAIPANATQEQARDLIQHPLYGTWVFNGTFHPELSHYLDGVWSSQTVAGWSTVNNESYGGIALLGDYIYVTDNNTAQGGAAQGIVRFHVSGAVAPARFLSQFEYIDVTAGLDGKLYALRNTYGDLDVIEPQNMTLLASLDLGHSSESRAVAATAEGEIFMASWDGSLYHYDATGSLLNSVRLGGALFDIDIHPQHGLLISNRLGQVWLLDFQLQIRANFTAGQWGVFVAFGESAALPDYCVSQGQSTHFEWIDSFSLNGTEIPSGDNQGYRQHGTVNVSLQRDQPNTLLLRPGFRSGAFAEYWGAWADFNRNGQFEETEKIVSTRSNSAVLTTFDVPEGVAPGPLVVRIAMRFDAPPSNCGEFYYGEVEDLVVTLE
jgi:hypothetical protein